MRPLYKFLFALMFVPIMGNAQDYHKGVITTNKGKEIEAHVLINYAYPQRYQNGIKYLTPKDYAKYKKKGKTKDVEKLNPKDIKGFALEDGRKYKTVSFIDIFSVSKTGMIPRKMVLEQVADGKIQMFKYFSHTTGKKVSQYILDQSTAGHDNIVAWQKNNFQLLVLKDTKQPKHTGSINLKKYIGDNAEVKENFDNNHYGLRNIFSNEMKYGKYVGPEFEAAFLRMLADYNK